MKSIGIASLALAGSMLLSAAGASAGCVNKAAEATSTTADSAKWFVLETMVQGVSWSLWPGFVATGEVAGYTVTNKRYKCKEATGGVFCKGTATFCKKI